jgi:hypothetical protein
VFTYMNVLFFSFLAVPRRDIYNCTDTDSDTSARLVLPADTDLCVTAVRTTATAAAYRFSMTSTHSWPFWYVATNGNTTVLDGAARHALMT